MGFLSSNISDGKIPAALQLSLVLVGGRMNQPPSPWDVYEHLSQQQHPAGSQAQEGSLEVFQSLQTLRWLLVAGRLGFVVNP